MYVADTVCVHRNIYLSVMSCQHIYMFQLVQVCILVLNTNIVLLMYSHKVHAWDLSCCHGSVWGQNTYDLISLGCKQVQMLGLDFSPVISGDNYTNDRSNDTAHETVISMQTVGVC